MSFLFGVVIGIGISVTALFVLVCFTDDDCDY